MKTVLFGILWFFVFMICAISITAMIIVAVSDPQNPEAAGYAFGQQHGSIIFYGVLIFTVLGSIFGWLPGTKSTKKK
jgi:hypothetical protein